MISLAAPALALVQLQATLARADQGSGRARLRLYTGAMPAAAGPISEAPMCEIVLAKPCGAITAGVLSLAAEGPAQVLLPGAPRWAEWLAADGAQLHLGDVTDQAHDGFWRVDGATTPAGDTSPAFQMGGMLVLGGTEIG